MSGSEVYPGTGFTAGTGTYRHHIVNPREVAPELAADVATHERLSTCKVAEMFSGEQPLTTLATRTLDARTSYRGEDWMTG